MSTPKYPPPASMHEASGKYLPAASLSWGASAGDWTTGIGDCCDDCGIWYDPSPFLHGIVLE